MTLYGLRNFGKGENQLRSTSSGIAGRCSTLLKIFPQRLGKLSAASLPAWNYYILWHIQEIYHLFDNKILSLNNKKSFQARIFAENIFLTKRRNATPKESKAMGKETNILQGKRNIKAQTYTVESVFLKQNSSSNTD